MYYTAKATPIVEGRWYQDPGVKVEHGTHLPSVLSDLGNEVMGETHTPDGEPIVKWHIELRVDNDDRRAAPEAITNRLMWWQNG